MQEKVQQQIEAINQDYMESLSFSRETAAGDLEKAVEQLTERIREQAVPLVYGRGHRKSQIQKDKEYLENCLERQNRYDIHKKNFRGRNSYSKTDPDATFMHMKDDHMRNAQLKPGYNIQIGVDSEYIMGVGVFADRNDTNTLIPFFQEMKANLNHRYHSRCRV